MDELVNQQNNDGTVIQNLIANYKKAPLDRRTIDMYQTKLTELNSAWDKFNKRDNLIRRTYGEEGHAYFREDYYAVIGGKYEAAQSELETIISKLSQPPKPNNQGSEQQNVSSQLPQTSSQNNEQSNSGINRDQSKLNMVIQTVQKLIREVLNINGRSAPFYNLKLNDRTTLETCQYYT